MRTIKQLGIAGLSQQLAPLILAPHLACKQHDDLDFDTHYQLGGNGFYLHDEGGGTGVRQNMAAWMRRRGRRDELVLILQICHGHDETTSDIARSRFSKSNIIRDIREHLDLLETDHLDLVVLGGDNDRIPASPIMDALESERSAGRVRGYGTGNWTAARIHEANAYATANGYAGFSFIMTSEASLAIPTAPTREGYVPFDLSMSSLAESASLPVFAWISDFNHPLFIPSANPSSDNPQVNRWFTPPNRELLKRAQALGMKYGLDERQINVAYILNQPFPTAGIYYQDIDPRPQDYFRVLESEIPREELMRLKGGH
jgi:aryl-alcohol dehydrogenase-like predicted oxidoreductase